MMPRKPHYTPGVSRMKKCTDCEQWLPITEFHKAGLTRHGKPQFRGYCKACYKERRKAYENSAQSPCWSCEDIDDCKAALHLLVDVGDRYEPAPLPCYVEGVTHATQ